MCSFVFSLQLVVCLSVETMWTAAATVNSADKHFTVKQLKESRLQTCFTLGPEGLAQRSGPVHVRRTVQALALYFPLCHSPLSVILPFTVTQNHLFIKITLPVVALILQILVTLFGLWHECFQGLHSLRGVWYTYLYILHIFGLNLL